MWKNYAAKRKLINGDTKTKCVDAGVVPVVVSVVVSVFVSVVVSVVVSECGCTAV